MKRKGNFLGDAQPTKQEMTAKGLLCRDAVLAIAPQVREYHASELQLSNWKKGRMVKILTDEKALFSDDVYNSLSDFVEDHPQGVSVTPENWKQHSIGGVQNVRRVGDELQGDLLIRDADAIKKVSNKSKIALSLGYDYELVLKSGVTDSGEEYDGVITGIIADHVALVKNGRGGSRVKIGDEKKDRNVFKIKLANGQTFSVEGENLEALEQGINAQNLELKNLQEAANQTIKIGDKDFNVKDTAGIQAAFASLEEENKTVKAEAAEATKGMVKAEDVEAKAAERAEVVTDAKSLKPDLDDKGKTIEQIKAEVVAANDEDVTVKAVVGGAVGDALPEKMDIAFAVLVANSKKDQKEGENKAPSGKVGDSQAAANALNDLNNKAGTPSDASDLLNRKSQKWNKGVK